MSRKLFFRLFTLGAVLFLFATAAVRTAQAFTFAPGDVVVGVGNGQYKVFDPTLTTLLTTLDTTSGSFEDTGGAFDATGNLFVTNFEANSVSEFNSSGVLVNASFGGPYNQSPESITFNSAGDVFVGQADGTHHVLEFSPTGVLLNTFAPLPDSRGTDWIDLAPDGKTLYYASEGTHVNRFDISTNTQLTALNSVPLTGGAAFALRLLPNGNVLVADTSQVVQLDGVTGAIVKTYTDPALTRAFALNILPDGLSFLTANINSTGEIFEFNIATGLLEKTLFPNPTVDVAGLIVDGELGIGPPPPTTTPEPSSLILLGSGLIALFLLARRKMVVLGRVA
jgi:WD40 repeat protein